MKWYDIIVFVVFCALCCVALNEDGKVFRVLLVFAVFILGVYTFLNKTGF